MLRIFDITLKDLLQLVRDRKIFLFYLFMPLAFTLLFGFASGGFSKEISDSRLPVGFLDQDGSWLSKQLHNLLDASQVIRLEKVFLANQADLQALVADNKLAAALVVPPGYGSELLHGRLPRLTFIGDTSTPTGMTVESESLSAVQRLESALRTALILERAAGDMAPFDYTFEQALEAWEEPPIRVNETTSSAIQNKSDASAALAHTSPGMMLQFAIAGLLTSAQIMVNERKSRALQRLLTTRTARLHILLGHYLAILTLLCIQFAVLIVFGQLLLKVDYLSQPAATLLVALASAVCIAALGLLIGVMAKTEEQAVIFSLLPMFVLAGLGGAWVPLEVTGPTFQAVGHLSPIAWSMDGFKNVIIRGLGLSSALLPAAALGGYAILFFALAVWRMARAEES
ncbi:MAG: ABC transporter permease [Chloroflexota bacterium]